MYAVNVHLSMQWPLRMSEECFIFFLVNDVPGADMHSEACESLFKELASWMFDLACVIRTVLSWRLIWETDK